MKKKEEFNLSEKRKTNESWRPFSKFGFYWESDVKEFIRRLKEEIDNPSHDINCSFNQIKRIIDALAGEELSK